MKKILLTCVVAASLFACKSDDKKTTTGPTLTEAAKEAAVKDTANFTTIEWIDSTTEHVGKLKKNATSEITFRFKNSGTKNLVIENVSAQCGCTIPEKPEQAILPGAEGVIRAKYNGSGSGTITKQVYVTSNTKHQTDTLTFIGDIIE